MSTLSQSSSPGEEQPADLSPWWLRSIGIVLIVGFAVLLYITWEGYQKAPPIPDRVVATDGTELFTKADVGAGQSVFLKYGLMNNGTIWGHGAMIGPDFSADALHRIGLDTASALARQQFNQDYETLNPQQKAAVEAQVAVVLKENRYDAATGVLTLTEPEAQAWSRQPAYWAEYFSHPRNNGGLKAGIISDETELRQFSAFVTWAAWASVAKRPGENYSYTNNFPYDPLVGNVAIPGAMLWSALSLIALLGGLAGVLLVSGRFENLGWISSQPELPRIPAPGKADPGQRALVKFFAIVALVFLFQTLIGGALAHYRIEPDGFYGLPLERIFPSNLLRTWHLQSAIMWIATAYVAAALFLGTTLRKQIPAALTGWANFLFIAFVAVICGSLLGQWLGIEQMLGDWWFWLGNQGWEYLELGRGWQYLLAVGLLVWFGVLWWLARPGVVAEQAKPLVRMFMVAALAIPVFYVPALFYGAETNYTVVDTWRFWIIHLWVEGFFEFFATTVVALIFYQLGLARRNTALTIIYFDAILYFGGGLVGTGHHWYFTGHAAFNMAASSVVSALEVVPLTLLTLDAWAFVRTSRAEGGRPESQAIIKAHKWTIYFLMAVGFWNFFGAGVFGFLINLPIVSYYQMGTQLTANHGHAALMGVFGMLAIAVMVFVLRHASTDEDWRGIEKWIKVTFWGTNAGLLMMTLMSLFPSGVLQVWDVLENGYWHARSHAYMRTETALAIEWLRFPGDAIFIVFGSVPLAIAALKAWAGVRRQAA